jgi:tetratricopeptide (TPR) repeat protein
MKKWIAIVLAAAFVWLVGSGTLYAQLPYITTYYDHNQAKWFWIQPIYTPAAAYTANFQEPVDLYIGADDKVFIADKKLNRIIVLSNDGMLLRSVGDEEGPGKLSAPEGVFVTSDGTIYVADSGNQRIAVFDISGKFAREYKKPNSTTIGSEPFVPTKLVVDRRGVMYIALNASYQGLVRLDQAGEFMGYFGANKAQQTALNWLKKLILNKEQLAKENASLPKPIKNVSMDGDGFIYTATAGAFGKGAIRKLNAGGVDALKNKKLEHGNGIVDTAIGRDGFLYNVDLDSKSINLYDRTGEALFSFGHVDMETQQYGVLGYPTGIGVDSHDAVWISDSGTKTVHKFLRTEFGGNVLKALVLYMDSKYEESKPYWDKVYASNDMYNGTFQGLGKVYLQENDNEQALEFMKLAFDTDGYSKAFWQIRLNWLQSHFVTLTAWLVGLWIVVRLGWKGLRTLLRKHPLPSSWNKMLEELRNFGYVMFHPYHGFYRLKEVKVAPWITLLLLAAVVGTKLASLYMTGFLFHPIDLADINLFSELGQFAVPWITWIIANYLVCSVKDGEGKFREIIQGSTYALAPYLFFSILIIALSNIVSLEEKVAIDSLQAVMVLWLAAMFFVMTQVIHNFDFVETLKNSAITVFAIGTIWLFGFLIFGLSYNLYDFFYQLYKEVSFNR